MAVAKIDKDIDKELNIIAGELDILHANIELEAMKQESTDDLDYHTQKEYEQYMKQIKLASGVLRI